jgi:heme exporter protein CcmD
VACGDFDAGLWALFCRIGFDPYEHTYPFTARGCARGAGSEGCMMVDFGKHTLHIWLSYGVTIGLLVALALVSLNQSRAAKKRLDEVESKHG